MTSLPTAPLDHDVDGTGPLLVAIHGITEDRTFWDRVPLAERFHVIRVDLRGHGRSRCNGPYDPWTMAADVHALVSRLAPDQRPLVLGHSFGGLVATAYASRYPVRGVVNVDQGLRVTPFPAQVAEAVRGDGFVAFMTAAFAPMYGDLDPAVAEDLQARRVLRRDVVLGCWAPLLDLTPEALEEWMDAVMRMPRPRPYLSLHGTDPGEDYADWLRERLPEVQIERAPSATHYPHLGDPAWFLRRLAAFDGTLAAHP